MKMLIFRRKELIGSFFMPHMRQPGLVRCPIAMFNIEYCNKGLSDKQRRPPRKEALFAIAETLRLFQHPVQTLGCK